MTTPSPAKILVLDDEAELRQLLQRYLGEQGFQVRTLADSSQLYKLLQRESFDALVLDLMMPNEDGLSVCRNLRAQGESLPIIMLTARGDPLDRIIGLEMGADDYLAKPFTPRELVARIQAILRRQRLAMQPVAPHKLSSHSDTVSFGDFVLNLETQTLTRNGEVLPLSSTEFLLLRAFVANAGRTLGRERCLGFGLLNNSCWCFLLIVDWSVKFIGKKFSSWWIQYARRQLLAPLCESIRGYCWFSP